MSKSTRLWTLAVLVAVVLFLAAIKAIVEISRAEAVCDPVAVRPWAERDFNARISAKPPVPWPTPASSVQPALTAIESPTPDGAKLNVKFDPKPRTVNPTWPLFERVPVGPTMAATLPDGLKVELLYWRAEGGLG